MIRRNWTAHEADEWTKEDWITLLVSSTAYFLLAVGSVLSLLLRWYGFVLLGLAVVAIVLMHWIIDPKLQAISTEYEKKQQAYLDELEKKNRWQTDDE